MNKLINTLQFCSDFLIYAKQATVMEVKEIVGLGTTIDVLVVNGRIKEGDTIIVGGVEGPIITQVRFMHLYLYLSRVCNG